MIVQQKRYWNLNVYLILYFILYLLIFLSPIFQYKKWTSARVNLRQQQQEPGKVKYLLAAWMCHMWKNSGFLSCIHWKKAKSNEHLHTSHHLRCNPTQTLHYQKFLPIGHPLLHVYPQIQHPPLHWPKHGFCNFLTFFSDQNWGFNSFFQCCQDALYSRPTFFSLLHVGYRSYNFTVCLCHL